VGNVRNSTHLTPLWTAALVVTLGFGAAATSASVASSAASAQDVSVNERALARRAFRQGMSAARAERWEDARVAFERAWELVHRPRVLLNLATAQVHTGHLVQGAENYRQYLREAGPDADERLSAEARRRLTQVERRTPQLTVRAPGLAAGDELALDGTPLSRAALAAQLPVDPGEHVVTVMRDGEEVARATTTLRERRQESLRIEVPAPAPQAVVPDPADAALQGGAPPDGSGQGLLEPPPEEPPSDSEGGVLRSPWLWIAVGLAVGGGVAAGVLLTRDSGQGAYQGNIGPGFLEVQ